MAIDSKQKRWSMMNFASPIPGLPMFEPDGALDADDRFHMMNLYGGLVDDGGSPPAASGIHLQLPTLGAGGS